MDDPYVVGAVIVGVVNVAAALLGLLLWSTGRSDRSFWLLARTGQALAAVYAAFAGIYAVAAEPPPDGLAWVYILTPVAVSFFAEQLRLVSAQTVIERYGFATVGELREATDASDEEAVGRARGIAHEVVLRELGIIAIGAFVIAFLAWRAVLTG